MPDHSDIPEEALLECAVAAARAAGHHARDNFSRRTEVEARFEHDVKLRLDIECQKKAEQTILERFPNHSFLGEEQAEANTGTADGYQWIVDPIDGTINFSHGLPFWCCSVAVRRGSRVMAGTVYAPMLNELYSATVSGPAELNGSSIRVSKTETLKDSIVYTGTDRKFKGNPAPLTLFKAIAMSVQRTRVSGFAAFDVCQVAAGRADGYFEGEIYIWDISAGGLIVERAGGRTERLSEPDRTWKMSFMATNDVIHEELKSTVTNTESR